MNDLNNRAEYLMKLISEHPASSKKGVIADKLSLLMNEIRLEASKDKDLIRVVGILATLAALLRLEKGEAIAAIGATTAAEIQKLK